MPKVSVLIPTYNYAHYLDEAIQSVLNQTLQDFELVVVDNCSTDNTDEVVQKYLTDQRVRYYKNPANFGHVGNWNICLSRATGEYLKFLCADDKFREDCLEQFVQVMDQNPNVSLVVCNKQMFGKSSVIVQLPLQYLHSGKEIIYHTLNTKGWLGEPTCVMFRRSNLNLGYFKTGFIWLPDWEMWLRHLTVGDCYIIPEPVGYVRNHSGQVTKMIMREYINRFEEYELCKAIQEDKGYHFDKTGIDMERVVKRRAEKCAAIMYKVLPRIHRKHERSTFFKAFKIAMSEHVVLNPLFQNRIGITKDSHG